MCVRMVPMQTYTYKNSWQNDSQCWLAAGTKEGPIVLFSADVVNGIYTKVGLLKGHTGSVTSIDFSTVTQNAKPTIMRVSPHCVFLTRRCGYF
jgi:hypothetical protein